MSTKPREFWVIPEDSIDIGSCYSSKFEGTIHVREVLPNDSQENKVNWEKVWNSYDTARLCPNEGPRKLIQQLVEKSLKGEL